MKVTAAWAAVLLLAAFGAGASDEKPGAAFGRIDHTYQGAQTGRFPAWMVSEKLVLYVRAATATSVQTMEIESEGGGRFFWPLRAGEYEIIAYRYERAAPSRWYTGARIMARFSVPQADQAAYIGDLRIETTDQGVRMRLLDRRDEAVAAAQPALSEGARAVVTGLMQMERQEPGKVRAVVGVCSGSWGIECDKTVRGVMPVRPEDGVHNFPLAEDRRPLLEWKPSARSDVTYDVAIYESLNLSPIGITFGPGGGPRLRATRVAYAEGLREPQFRPAEPLPAGRRFEWSVRLRDGDTVSSWSSTSHDVFLLVAASRGSGRYFGFETPSQ